MASLIKAKSGIFYIVFSHQSKHIWRSLRTRDKREAYRKFLEEQNQQPGKKVLTLFQAEEEYLAFVKTNLSPKTYVSYTSTFKSLKKHFGNRPIEEITARDMEFYKSNRAATVSANTVNHDLRMVRAFFNKLVDWKILRESPCAKVKDIRVVDETRAFLSTEELDKLLKYLKGSFLHDIVLFAAMAGMRRGEIINLSWNDVDIERKVIMVRSSGSYQTKAGKIRTIPMNSTVLQLLSGRPHSSKYVFTGKRGDILNGNFVRGRLKAATKTLGLDSRLHFHSLRHTFASLLVQRGISLYHVQKLLGHSSPRVTEIYAHLGTSELSGSVEKLAIAGN
jgi:integrase